MHTYIIYWFLFIHYIICHINKTGLPVRSALFLHIKNKKSGSLILLYSLYLLIIAAFSLNVSLRHSAGQVYCTTRSLQGGYLELSRPVLNCLFTTLSLPKVSTQGKAEELASLTSSFMGLLTNH